MRHPLIVLIAGVLLLAGCVTTSGHPPRVIQDFDRGWRFRLGDAPGAMQPAYPDSGWQRVTLPHDWSIEGPFSEDAPATAQEGALPTGIGWYRKRFTLAAAWKDKNIYLDFGGVYRDSKVWINGHLLGRFWEIGPQESEFVPAAWLKSGRNAVVVFDMMTPATFTLSGVTRPLWK